MGYKRKEDKLASQRRCYRRHRAKRIAEVYARKLQYVAKAREAIFNYLLAHPCVDCGESDPLTLHFDHTDPTSKQYNISKMVGTGLTVERIMREVCKCEVRCANCHAKKTAVDRGWWMVMRLERHVKGLSPEFDYHGKRAVRLNRPMKTNRAG